MTSRSPRITPEDLSGTADEIPGDIRDDYLDLPDGFSPRVQRARRRAPSTATPRRPADQARALQDYLRTFDYSLERAAGPQRGRARGLPLREPGRATASSSPAPSRRWRGRSASRRASPSASPPGELDPDRPRHLHRARRVRPRVARGVHRRRRLGAPTSRPRAAASRTPRRTPVSPSSRPRPATPAASTIAPTTETTVAHPVGRHRPVAGAPRPRRRARRRRRQPRRRRRRARTPRRSATCSGRSSARSPIVLGLRARLRSCCSRSGWLVRRRRRRQPGRRRRSSRSQLAWTEAVEAAAIAGFEERASDTYVERALRLGQAVPEAADPALTLAARLEVGIYSADGAEPDDADRRLGGRRRPSARPRRRRPSTWERVQRVVRPPLAAAVVAAGPGRPPAPHHADAARPTSRPSASWSAPTTAAERARYSSSAWRKRSRMRPRAPPRASRKPVALIERVTCSSPALPSLRRLRSK